jgi:hypothetical protein
VQSLSYALLFGIGTIAEANNTIFYMPAPVLYAVFATHPKSILDCVIIPFFVCWLLIFAVMSIDSYFKKKTALAGRKGLK